MRGYLMIGLGLLLGLSAAWAGDGPATGPAPSPGPGSSTQPAGKHSVSQDHIAQLIDRLGSEKFAEREAAVKELIEIGRPALAALKAAASDKTPERASRAQSTLKVIEENLIPPEAYRAKIAAYIGPTSEDQRAASHKWIHERLGATVPYLLELAPKVAGEQAVRLHMLMFDAWQQDLLSDDQKTRFFGESVRVGWRVDPRYWPGGGQIAVLAVTGMGNVLPDWSNRLSRPWNFLKAGYTAELDGVAIARGKTSADESIYVMLPKDIKPGKHKLRATVEFAELDGRWRFSMSGAANITVLAAALASAPVGPPPAKITGLVVDDSGAPVANVPVSAKSNSMGQPLWWAFEAQARSDKHGRFELTVPFDDIIYHIVLGSYGIYHLSDPAQLIPLTGKPVKLVLQPDRQSHVARGKVSYADGSPSGGLEVALIGEYDRRCQATTDANGNFQVTARGYMGQTVAIVRSGNLAVPLKMIRISGDKKPLDLTLEPTASLEGIVRDENDQTLITGATVLVRPWYSNSFKMETTTGKDGRYRLDGIPAGEYVVRVSSAPGHFHWANRWEFPRVDLPAGQIKQADIDLERLALLRGKVVDHTGRPVAGAMVAAPMRPVYDYREQYDCVRTAADGSFLIATGVVDHALTIGAYRSDKGVFTVETRQVLQPGQILDGLVLKTAGTARIKATVTDPRGKPVKDVQCEAGTYGSVSACTAPDGRADLGRIALRDQGVVTVTIRTPRPYPGEWKTHEVQTMQGAPTFYLHQRLSLKLQPDQDQDLKITLKPTSLQKIFGRVVDGAGKPVAGAEVHLFTGDANEQTWIKTLRPMPYASDVGVNTRDTVICNTRTGADGQWTIWTVREDGVALPSYGWPADWSKYCIGILGPGNRNLLVRNIVVPEAYNTVELLIDLQAGKSRTVTTRPATQPR